MNNKFLLLIVLAPLVVTPINATASYNDILSSPFLHRECHQKKPLFFFTKIDLGFNGKGFNTSGEKVAIPQYLDATQNGLAMVKGGQSGTQIAALGTLLAGAGDDGIRGHFVVDGDYKRSVTATLGALYSVTDNWWVSAFLPVISASFKHIVWLDQTQGVTPEDVLFENLLGIDFFNQVEQLSNGLSLEEWEKTGTGDLSLWVGWHQKFNQQKEWIKQVTPHIRAGITCPTGVKKDENKSFFLPFGNDGAAGLQVGFGLTVNLKELFNIGMDIEILHAFSTTRERRIKTDANQTESLLLTKTLVSKDPGLVSRFNLFGEIVPTDWLQARVQYSYSKQSDSHLYPISNTFSATIANTATSLQGFTTHSVVGVVEIAGSNYSCWIPDMMIGFTHPFHGKRCMQADQLSIGFSYSF